MANKWIYVALGVLNIMTASIVPGVTQLHATEYSEDELVRSARSHGLFEGNMCQKTIRKRRCGWVEIQPKDRPAFSKTNSKITEALSMVETEHCQVLIKNKSLLHVAYLTAALNHIAENEKADFTQYFKKLVLPDMGGFDVCQIIETLVSMPSDDRALFVEPASTFYDLKKEGHLPTLSSSDISDNIKILSIVTRSEIRSITYTIIEFAMNCWPRKMGRDKLNNLLRSLAATPAKDREHYDVFLKLDEIESKLEKLKKD